MHAIHTFEIYTDSHMYVYIYICFISFIPFNFFFYRPFCRPNPWRHGPEIFHCGFTQLFRITIWRHGPQHKLCFLGEILPKSHSFRFVNDYVFCCLPIYLFSQILVYLNPLFCIEIRSVTSQCVVPPFLEKGLHVGIRMWPKKQFHSFRSGYEDGDIIFHGHHMSSSHHPHDFRVSHGWKSSQLNKFVLVERFGIQFWNSQSFQDITPKITWILLNVTWTWFTNLHLRRVLWVSSAPFTRRQNQPICEVTPLVLQHIDDFTLQVRGQTNRPPTKLFVNFTRIFSDLIFQMPPICSFVICNFSCQNAERRLIKSCFFASSRVFGWLLFLSRFCLGILSHIQKSNMAMFGSKLASRLCKVKHLPNSGFSGIQWVDLLLSSRNWAMSRGAVVPCNCAEKQLVTPDLHAETNWLCWWVGLRIFY